MIRIAIVDDHILFREGLKAVIRSQPDFEVVGLAATVQEATGLVLAHRPDIVLMNFTLPDGSGVDAIRAILAEYDQCKIILMAISGNEEDVHASIRSGGKGFISKNMAPSQLVEAIRSVQSENNAFWPAMAKREMSEFSHSKAPEAHTGSKRSKLTELEMEAYRACNAGRIN